MNTPIIAIISKIRQNANNLILKELKETGLEGLSPSHGDILAVLFQKDNIPTQDIAKKIKKTKATTTVLLDKLEKEGFITREKSSLDNRITNILLTKKGTDFKPIFEKISNKLNATAFKDFKIDEIIELEAVLRKIEENLK